jgi:CRISPR-associated protein Csx14
MEAMLATLGTEPQVVTLALDALLARGHPIGEVVVVHTHPSGLGGALERLRHEEAYYSRGESSIAFRYVPVREREHYPADIVSEEDAALLLRVLYREVAALKRAGRRVHLSIAGGRKVMAAYGMVVAQLLLSDEDWVWHLLSEPQVLRSRQMHVPGTGVSLVPVPVLRWSLLPSAMADLLVWDDPYRAIQRQREMREHLRRRALAEFWRSLTPAERRIAAAMVAMGGSNERIGRAVGRRAKTVANHLLSIYQKYRAWLGVAEEERVRERLVADLASAPELLGEFSWRE